MKDAEGIVYRRVLFVCAVASKAERHSVGWGKGVGGLYASLIMCKCVLVCVWDGETVRNLSATLSLLRQTLCVSSLVRVHIAQKTETHMAS